MDKNNPVIEAYNKLKFKVLSGELELGEFNKFADKFFLQTFDSVEALKESMRFKDPKEG